MRLLNLCVSGFATAKLLKREGDGKVIALVDSNGTVHSENKPIITLYELSSDGEGMKNNSLNVAETDVELSPGELAKLQSLSPFTRSIINADATNGTSLTNVEGGIDLDAISGEGQEDSKTKFDLSLVESKILPPNPEWEIDPNGKMIYAGDDIKHYANQHCYPSPCDNYHLFKKYCLACLYLWQKPMPNHCLDLCSQDKMNTPFHVAVCRECVCPTNAKVLDHPELVNADYCNQMIKQKKDVCDTDVCTGETPGLCRKCRKGLRWIRSAGTREWLDSTIHPDWKVWKSLDPAWKEVAKPVKHTNEDPVIGEWNIR